jgi:hypothetical protein
MTFARSPWAVVMVLVAALLLSICHRPAPLQAQQPPAVVEPKPNSDQFEEGSYQHLHSPSVVHLPARPMTLEATRVYLKLLERIPMEFPHETTLGDVLKHIKAATMDNTIMPNGIPIYVDPVGLKDADKALSDKIRINLKGIPLATTLKLALHQLSLVYRIHPDGLVYITSTASEETPPNLETQIMNDMNRIEVRLMFIQGELTKLRGVTLPRQNPSGNPAANAQGAGGMGGGFR